MKRKFILLPITLTALAPAISLVGCGDPDKPEPEVHKVKIDSSSDTDISVTTQEITLHKQLVMPYEIINLTRELDATTSWIKFGSGSKTPLNRYAYVKNKVIIPAWKVTTYDITICFKSKQVPEYIGVVLLSGGNTHYSEKITLEKGKSYKFIIEDINPLEDNFVFTDEDPAQERYINANINKILVNGDLSTDYKLVFTNTEWIVTSWHHEAGNAEVYISVNETANDVYARTIG